MTTWYHGTSPEAADKIRAEGFRSDIHAKRDAGDIGLGLYFTRTRARATSYGSEILEVELKGCFAHVRHPYFLDETGNEIEPDTGTEVEQVFYDIVFDRYQRMRTVQGPTEERVRIATAVRRRFLYLGFDGIISDNPDEAVVFNEDCIAVRCSECHMTGSHKLQCGHRSDRQMKVTRCRS